MMTEASLLPRIFLPLSAQAHLSPRSSTQGLAIYCYVGQPSFARSPLFSPSRNNTYYIYVYDYVHDQGSRLKPVGAGLRHKGFSPSFSPSSSHIYYIDNKIYVYIDSTVPQSSSSPGSLVSAPRSSYIVLFMYTYIYTYTYTYMY